MARFLGQYLLLLLTASGLLVSQLLLKQGAKSGGAISLTSLAQLGGLIRQILTSPLLLLGYGLSGFTALLWLVILSRLEVSYAAPMLTAIYYVLLLLTSALVLREGVTLGRWIGTLLIIAGIAVIARAG